MAGRLKKTNNFINQIKNFTFSENKKLNMKKMTMKEYLRFMKFKTEMNNREIAEKCKITEQCLGNKMNRGTISVTSLLDIQSAMGEPLIITTKEGESIQITK